MDKPIYNEELKSYFIKSPELDFTLKQKEQYKGFFEKTYTFEKKARKDLYDFTFSELEVLLKDLAYKSTASITRDIGLLNSYVTWSIQSGHSNNQSHRVISMARSNIGKFLYKHLNSVYSKDELFEALKDCKRLYELVVKTMFEGIGSSKFNEIQTLKTSMLYEEYGNYYTDLENRTISISKELYDELMTYNDVLNDSTSYQPYIPTEYIFKPYHRKGKEFEVYISKTIRNYIWRDLKEILNDKRITNWTIIKSSLNYYAYQEMEKSGEKLLTVDILRKIADRHGIHTSPTGHYLGKIVDDLDIDFMKDVYGEFEIDDMVKSKMI